VLGSDGSSSLGSRQSGDPYAAFHTNFRFWMLWSPIGDPQTASQRIIVQAPAAGGGNGAVPSNLALLARAGLRAQSAGSKIVVFVGKGNTGPLSAGVRANAYSYLVFFPSDNSPAALNHELGHTLLGELADEYGNHDHPAVYYGLEPTYRNVSTNTFKWHWWHVNNRAWSHGTPFFPVQGAFYANNAIYRPSNSCLMHGPDHGEGYEHLQFCEICRAAVTRGIRRAIGGNGALVEFEYLSPFRVAAQRVNIQSQGASAVHHMEAYDGTWNQGRTAIQLRLLADTLPKPWTVRWQLQDNRGGIVDSLQQTYHPTTSPDPVTFYPHLGYRLVLEISSGYLVPADTGSVYCANPDCSETIRPYRVELIFDQARRAPSSPPSPPTDLRQTPVVGSQTPITYDPRTGAISMSLSLSARAGGYPGLTFPVQTEFSIQGPQANRNLLGTPLGQIALWGPGPMALGFYTWAVRSVFNGLASDWVSLPLADRFDLEDGQRHLYHFQVTRQPGQGLPPVAPVDLQVYQPTRGPRIISLSATSWSPQGDRLRLEFEVRPGEQAFTNSPTATTEWLSGTRDSARVTGGTSVGPLLTTHHWQVRAMDERGRASPWVNGGSIISLP